MSSVDNAASATKSNVHTPLPASEKREDETPGAVSPAPVNVPSNASHPEPSPSSKQKESDALLPPNNAAIATAIAVATTPPSTTNNNDSTNINHNSSTGVTPTPSQQPSPPPTGGPGEEGKGISSSSAEMQSKALPHTAQPTSPLLQPTALVPSGTSQTQPATSPPQIDAPPAKISPQDNVAQPQDDDNASIASNVQEHSNGSETGSCQLDLIEDTDETQAKDTTETLAKDTKQAITSTPTKAQGPPIATLTHTTEAPVSVLSQPNHGRATPSGGRQAPSCALETEDGDESSEPAASYTSPHHEWARILQRRLNKGLNDAQLARSNSMLASPSIIAQSLVQVIPSLQVKEASSRSPGSPAREYQTAEELFDRPAAIEPSAKYEDTHTRDDAFPSANMSSAPLLLFAPLNPDDLNVKKSKSKQPPPPATEAQPVSSEPPTSGTQEKEPKEPKEQQDKAQHKHKQLAPTSLQPAPSASLVGQPSIPAVKSLPAEPLTGDNPSPVSPKALVTPTNQTRSPLIARDQTKNSAPNLSANSRTLVNQASSSSLTGTQGAIPKDLGTNSNNPIRPIQYTPVTQYKANPAKKRDASTSKETKIESPKEVRVQTENGEPEPSVDSKVETSTASAAADLWALEALSGLTEFKFDTTLPVSAVVATTLAGSTANNLGSKQDQLAPSVRRGSSASDAPVVAKVIQSPFESNRLSHVCPHNQWSCCDQVVP